MSDKRPCTTQFFINQFSKDEREHLLKKDVREEVCKYADVDIAIRGRHIPEKDLASTDSSRQLHLSITGRTKHNLNMAVEKLVTLVKKASGNADDTCLEEKITVGIDSFPLSLRIPAKILGENNENANYLTKETGATISLFGKGSLNSESKDDVLHILVKYKDAESKPNAQELILNLIETVQQDFIENYGKDYPRPKKPEIFPIKKPEAKVKKVTPPPSKEIVETTKNVSEEGSHIEKITLGLKHVPLKFNLKSKIYGPNLSNVKHIEKVSSAVLLVEGVNAGAQSNVGESSESPHILVKYLKPELKNTARSLILNLIETIHQEFTSLYGAYLEKPATPEIIPIKNANFSKPPPSENVIKKPPEKKPPLKVQKYPEEERREQLQIPEKLPAAKGPVPPPPPVISKPVSPVAVNSTPKHSVNVAETKTASRRVPKPVKPVSFKLNNPKEPQNIKPIPSIVSSVAGISTKPRVLAPTYGPEPTVYEISEIPTTSNVTVQPYYKRRSNSPVEMGHESKKFCSQPSTAPPYVGNIESIDNFAVSREPSAKSKASANRYLVPLPEVSSTPVSATPPTPIKPPSPIRSQTSLGNQLWNTVPTINQPPSRIQPSLWDVPLQRDLPPPNPTPAPVSAGNSTSIWTPASAAKESVLQPPSIPATWNPPTRSNASTPWGYAGTRTPAAQSNLVTPANNLAPQSRDSQTSTNAPTQPKKPAVTLNLRGPYKQQSNGTKVADSDAVLSFLNECAKATAKRKYDLFGNSSFGDASFESSEDDNKSIILIESDEENFDENLSNLDSGTRRSKSVQTDETLNRSDVRCACGRFLRTLTTVRSVAVQTAPLPRYAAPKY